MKISRHQHYILIGAEINTGTCNILNGGCGEICIPKSREDGNICECDVGLKLQADQSCDSGRHSHNFNTFMTLTLFKLHLYRYDIHGLLDKLRILLNILKYSFSDKQMKKIHNALFACKI